MQNSDLQTNKVQEPALQKAGVMRRFFKVGDKVKMINCGEADFYRDRVWICRTDSYMFPKGYERDEVVFLEGFAGCFLCSCLELVNGA